MIAAFSNFVQYLYVKDIFLSMTVVNPKHNYIENAPSFVLRTSIRIQNRVFSMEQNMSYWGCRKQSNNKREGKIITHATCQRNMLEIQVDTGDPCRKPVAHV